MDNPSNIAQQLKSNNLLEIHSALMTVRDHYVKHFDKMRELEKYSVMQIIVSFLEHPKLCNISLTIIDNVCHEKIFAFKIIRCNGIKFLTQIMKNLTSDDIQHQACKIVANIANYELDFKAFQTIELVANIIQFLLATDKIPFKQTALQTLCILGKDTKCRDLIIHENGIIHIAKLLNSANKDIILCCIQVLAELTENCNKDCVRQILGIKCLQILVDLYNKCETNIKTHIIKSLKNIATQELARSDLTKAGAIKLFAEVATDRKSFSNAKLALLGLCNCLGYIHMWDNYGTSRLSGLKVLVEALRHRDFNDIHHYIIIALLPLTFEQALADVLINLDLIFILIQILKSFNEQHKFDHKNSLSCGTISCTENRNSPLLQKKFQLDCEYFKMNKSCTSDYVDAAEKDYCKHNILSMNNIENEECNFEKSLTNSDNENNPYTEYFSRSHFLDNYKFSHYSSSINNRSSSDDSSDSLLSNFSSSNSWCSYSKSEGKSLSYLPEINPADDKDEYEHNNFSISVKKSVPDYKELSFNSIKIPKTTVSAEKSEITFMNLFSSDNNNKHNMCSTEYADFTSSEQKLLNECNVQSQDNLIVKEHKRNITNRYMNCDQFQEKDAIKRIKLTDFPDKSLERIKYFSFDSPVNSNAKILSIDNYILSLLTQLSFHLQKKSNSDFASSACFSILMQYCVQCANPKAEKILLIIVKNRYCFEKLVMSGFVSEMEGIFQIIHDPNICFQCSRVCSIYKNLNSAMRKEAESEYGIGTLCHILCTADKVYQFNAIYTISKLVDSKPALYKTLIQANGLAILLSLLSDFSNSFWKQAILCLCEVYQNLKKTNCKKSKEICCISQTCDLKLTTKCVYKDDILDVIFVIEGGIKIGASREKICRNSNYFEALLNGHFQEANKGVIKICGLSAETLTTIFHFLHGCCTTEYCPYIKEISFELLLEVFMECDKFLLFDIKSFIADRLCHNLYPSTLLKIYQIAKMCNSTSLHCKAMEYALSLDVSQKEMLQCFQEFLKLDSNLEVFSDIKKMIEDVLID